MRSDGHCWVADYCATILIKVGVWQGLEVFWLFAPLFSNSAALTFGEAELFGDCQVGGFDYFHDISANSSLENSCL